MRLYAATTPDQAFNKASVLCFELMFWVPFFAVPLAAQHYTSGTPSLGKDLVVSSYMSLVLAVLTAVNRRWVFRLRVICLAVLGLGSMFVTGVLLSTHGNLDQFLMMAILDTDRAETAEYAATHASLLHPLFFPIAFLPATALCIQRRHDLFWTPPPHSVLMLVVLLFLQLGARAHPIAKAMAEFPYFYPFYDYPPAQPYNILAEAVVSRAMIGGLSNRSDPVPGVTANGPPVTIVVVVGESLSKFHTHLYGYGRPTTPNLDHLAADGELVWFRNVVTTHALTLPALFAALTLQTPDGLRTVIDVFNTAGYETYWLSNQYQFAAHELNSALASIVYTAKQQVWLNSVNFTGDERVIQLDQHLLAPFRKALIDPAPRKLIFLHLIGSHFDYGAHYDRPYFSSFESPGCLTRVQSAIVNEYDNAVHYNDQVIGSVIGELRSRGINSALLYLSDHGEEVYDFRSYFGHEDALLTPYMAEVPFMVWMSPEYRRSHSDLASRIVDAVGRPASSGDLSEDIMSLAGVSLEGHDGDRSVLSGQFRPGIRMVAGKDYATFRSRWQPNAAHSQDYDVLPCQLPFQGGVLTPR